jgi:DAK2 domain fusion protein YloV
VTIVIEPTVHIVPSVWDGRMLLQALSSARDQLVAHRGHLNSLNVFPVPDGDTGTNMAMTMRAAFEEAEKLSSEDRTQVGLVARRIEIGALMGARGNSGVILSQIFRGFANEIANRSEIDGHDFARALSSASDMAYKAVLEPVEGTMLTVIRVAAEQAAGVTERTPSIPDVTAAALRGAETALARTPELLDKLRLAGVVDAGGQGIVYLLQGIDRFARGEPLETRGEPLETSALSNDEAALSEMAFLDRLDEIHGEEAFGYCTNFMIFGTGIPFERVRVEIARLGQSAVIVGNETIVKVHVHTENPGRLLDYAIQFGELDQIKIDNMNKQVGSVVEQRAERVMAEGAAASELVSGPAIVAVASGAGLTTSLRCMGAAAVVEGGQTMNPSIEELLDAVDNVASNEVILLPNNPNILLAAERVPELTSKRVVVIPSRSIPQALAALERFNGDRDLDANVSEMRKAVRAVRTIEIAKAEKRAQIDGLVVSQGQYIGLLDDRLVTAGDYPDEVALETIKLAGGDDAELVTAFIGEGGPPAESAPIAELLSSVFEDVEIQVYDGGQPHYTYVIAVE